MQAPIPRGACQALLQLERQDRIDKEIWPSEVVIIDRLLDRELELGDAYEEVSAKLGADRAAMMTFFDRLLGVAAFWSPQANAEARQGRDRLSEVNRQISAVAAQLAELLDERDELKNLSGFSCETHYHPIEVIHAASERNYSYQSWVKKKLDALTGQFDLKYWPSLSECMRVIAFDAAKAEPQPHDPITDAGTSGTKPSLADTFKAFFAAMDEERRRKFGHLPDDFELTDRSVASLLSCALGLGPDEVKDAAYVKRLRQRERARE